MQTGRQPPARRRNKSRRNALRTLRRRDTIGVLLLGKCEVGKTQLVRRWLKGSFNDNYNPTIEDFHVKSYRHMGQCVNVGVIDMTGSWDFSAMMDLYLNRVDTVMFVYDVNNESSIRELDFLYERLVKVRGENHDMLLTVVGTKLDKRQDCGPDNKDEPVHDFVEKLGDNCKHIQTSSKLNLNVKEAFENSLNELIATMIPNEDTIKRLGKLMKKNEKSGSCSNFCFVQ